MKGDFSMKKTATILLLVTLVTLSLTGCGDKNKIRDLKAEIKAQDKAIEEVELKLEEERAKTAQLTAEKELLLLLSDDYLEESENLDSLSSDYRAKIAELEAENKELKKQVNSSYSPSESDLQSQVNALTAELESYKKENSTLRQQVGNTSNYTLQNQINVLTAELENYKKVNEILQQQLADAQKALSAHVQSNSSSYISIKFWSDGNLYVSEKTVWYSDQNCRNKLSNESVIIASPIIDKTQLENGYIVYTCLSTNGLVYSSYNPRLTKVKN